MIDNILSSEYLIMHPEKDKTLGDFHFNVLSETSIIEKQRLAWSMLASNGFIEEFMIPINTLCEFLNIMKTKYNKRKNPFHNFDHAISGINIYSIDIYIIYSDAMLLCFCQSYLIEELFQFIGKI